ncbi:MAG TPA: transglutaminase family protein [Streptosporangiaceae bacterium]|jgi:transglutaminase-like putative cysteine protease|nr:transglutaminase family protein [Streptosporangiaceae bacterium]
MGWRVGVVHTTRVAYSGAARASYNECRMTPPTLTRQTALATSVRTGSNVPIWSYRDYWGTTVSSFDIQEPHEELLVKASATVQTSAALPAPRPLPWSELHDRAADSYVLEYLGETPRTTMNADVVAAVGGRVAGADPAEAASEIITWVREQVSYVPASTGVQTTAQEAWDAGQGVCQDMAHISVALLRAAGLPARYVSGYLHPDPKAEPGRAVAGQSHAWAEYWTGDWVACDPTNLAPVGERHVVLGRGRDYADVSPLRGIYSGAPSVAMEVTVEVTRLA